jgi:hypothetical protein
MKLSVLRFLPITRPEASLHLGTYEVVRSNAFLTRKTDAASSQPSTVPVFLHTDL